MMSYGIMCQLALLGVKGLKKQHLLTNRMDLCISPSPRQDIHNTSPSPERQSNDLT